MCWYEFDTQPSTTESAIEFNVTIDWQGLGAFLHSISKLHKMKSEQLYYISCQSVFQ